MTSHVVECSSKTLTDTFATCRSASRSAPDDAITAINAGADPRSLRTIEIEDMPIAYLPGNSLRVRVRVAGVA
jgi:hypothetical protein